MTPSQSMSTDLYPVKERPLAWADWISGHFGGLDSDLYGDASFDGRVLSSRAGEVVLTKLEANRHRVMRSSKLARTAENSYLKIVAPWQGSAAVEQHGRQAWVRPGGWAIYDTTGSYEVANPEQVEHLIVMLPKANLLERGLKLEPLMARHVGGSKGISRVALEAMRSTWQELPVMGAQAARRGRRGNRRAGAAVLAGAGGPLHRYHADGSLQGSDSALHQPASARPRTEHRAHRGGAQLQQAAFAQCLQRGGGHLGLVHFAPTLAGLHARPGQSGSECAHHHLDCPDMGLQPERTL